MGDLTQTFLIALIAFVLIIMGLVWNPYWAGVSTRGDRWRGEKTLINQSLTEVCANYLEKREKREKHEKTFRYKSMTYKINEITCW